MSGKGQRELPIGYWLKRADELLTSRIDEAQLSNNIARLDWQALNIIREKVTPDRQEVVAVLSPFADAESVGEVLSKLADKGFIRSSEGQRYSLTSAGADLFERALLTQREIRQRASSGISEADYSTAVKVLKRLVENLESKGSP